MMKTVIKKIFKKKKLKPVTTIGAIDEFSTTRLRGWLALSNKEKLLDEVVVSLSNGLEIIISDFEYREDLEHNGIANGYAGYDITLPDIDAAELEVKIMVNSKVILNRKIKNAEGVIKNTDPYFNKYYEKALEKNKSFRLDDGLDVQMLISGEYESQYSSIYFYRIRNKKLSKPKLIEISQNLKEKLFSNDAIRLSINTNLNSITKIKFFDVTNKEVCSTQVNIQPGWRTYEIDMCIFDYKKLALAERFILELHVSDGTYVDIGYILAGDLSAALSINKPRIAHEKIHNINLELVNSELSNAKLNNEFSVLKRKQLIASRLVYECKAGVESSVKARIVDSKLDLSVGNLNGYARLAYSIDMALLLNKPLTGVVSVCSASNTMFIKAVYIYAKGKDDRITNKIRLNFDSNDKEIDCRFSLDYKTVSQLIFETGENYEFRLAVELKENVEINGLSVNLNQDGLLETLEVFEVIEDSAISSQISFISGYYDKHLDGNNESSNALYVRKKQDEIIDIVIPVYNAKEYVIKCLDSIIRFTTMKYRIFLMDDCSTDGVSDVLDEYADKYDFINVTHHPVNVGYTGNVNSGFNESSSQWVLLLNSDTEVTPYWLENLYEATKQEKVGIVGPLGNAASWQSVPNVLSGQGGWDFNLLPEGVNAVEIAYQLNCNYEPSYVEAGVLNGFCQLINRAAFDRVGGLDEEAFPKGYGEENDLCARLINTGYKLLVTTNSYVYHHKSKSFGHETRSELSKKGSIALKEKHPDYDWGLVSKKLYNNSKMIDAREVVGSFLEGVK
jgi:GT2 family glycosyltransferase